MLVALLALVVRAMVTPLMWRDLRRRPLEQVRGPKWLWWIASSNLSGSAACWMLGRRQVDRLQTPANRTWS